MNEIAAPKKPRQPRKINYLTDPVFQQLQYYIRLSFEEGYRAGNTGVTMPNEWREDWTKSMAREWLLKNGLITGLEGYK
jgi:hypothetical protein